MQVLQFKAPTGTSSAPEVSTVTATPELLGLAPRDVSLFAATTGGCAAPCAHSLFQVTENSRFPTLVTLQGQGGQRKTEDPVHGKGRHPFTLDSAHLILIFNLCFHLNPQLQAPLPTD